MKISAVVLVLFAIAAWGSLNVLGACYKLVTVNCCGYVGIGTSCIDGGCPAGTPCCRQFEANPVIHVGGPVSPGGTGKTSLGSEPDPVFCKYRNPVCVLPERVCAVGSLLEVGTSPHTLAGDECSVTADPCPPSGCGPE